jgi:hypothetical protein
MPLLELNDNILENDKILGFNELIHSSPNGPWIGPYNIKSLGPFGRPTLQ